MRSTALSVELAPVVPHSPMARGRCGSAKAVKRNWELDCVAATPRREPELVGAIARLDALDQRVRRAYSHGMTRIVNLSEAKTHLSALIDAAERGEEIVIAKNGVAKARLVPVGEPARERKPSGLLHVRHIAEEFDAPDAEIIRLFKGNA